MFREEFNALADASVNKSGLLKRNPAGYIMLSILAGAYIGFGVLLTNTIGGVLDGAPYTRVLLGVAFGVALSLVVMAGAELFTGNNLVMAAGMLNKKVTLADTCLLFIVCWFGNLIGALILSFVFHLTALDTGATLLFMTNGAAAKTAPSAVALIARGALCNMLVCIATWCGTKLKSETGKLLMIFWCLFAFITTGFEHSIANMTLFGVLLIAGADGVTVAGAAYNLICVTAGNMIGGILFVALPYYLASSRHDEIRR